MSKGILFIESRYNSFYGAQQSLVRLIHELSDSYQCRVLTTGYGNFKEELGKRNMDVDIIPLGRHANMLGGKLQISSCWFKGVALFQMALFNLRLLRYLRRHDMDIIYVNDLRAFLYSFAAAKILRKKLVYYVRTDLRYGFLTRLAFRCSDRIITIANGVISGLPDSLVMKHQDKISNIYTGFKFDQYDILTKSEAKAAYDIPADRTVVGFVGSINPRKGLDLLIEALAGTERSDKYTLLIAGDVSEGHEEYWKLLHRRMGNDGMDFRYLGYCSDISCVLSAIDVLVLPSRSEGLPRTLIEAMAHELPVIATDVGGTKEIIENREVGVLVAKESVTELRDALTQLLTDADSRIRLGLKAKRHVERKFGLERYRSEIKEFFHQFV